MILWMLACSKEIPESNPISQVDLETIQRERPNIFVDKSEETLYLVRNGELAKDKAGQLISWPVSFGTGVDEGHKQKEGDKRTPEGLYLYGDYSAYSQYHGSLLLFYPNIEDAEQAFEASRITRQEREQIVRKYQRQLPPPMTTDLGGYILVHGTHKKGEMLFPSNVRYLWTDGCVGMSNNDIDALRVELTLDSAIQMGQILIVP